MDITRRRVRRAAETILLVLDITRRRVRRAAETIIKDGGLLTLLEPQSRFGDKPVKFQVVCPQSGTAVLKVNDGEWVEILVQQLRTRYVLLV